MKPTLSLHEPCLDYVQTAMRQKLDLLPLDDESRNVPIAFNGKILSSNNQFNLIHPYCSYFLNNHNRFFRKPIWYCIAPIELRVQSNAKPTKNTTQSV